MDRHCYQFSKRPRVAGVLDGRQLRGIGPSGTLVVCGGRRAVERVVGTLVIVQRAVGRKGLALGVTVGTAMAVHLEWTVYHPVHMHMMLLGFGTMMIYGVAYHVLPRFVGRPSGASACVESTCGHPTQDSR